MGDVGRIVRAFPYRLYCYVVGRDAVQVRRFGAKRLQRSVENEERVSFEVGVIMGVSLGTGVALYFIDSKRPVNTSERGAAMMLWPSMAQALEDSILDSEDPDETLERLNQRNFSTNRQLYCLFFGFMMFRASRRFWASRWGDLEFQRATVYMPWTSCIGLGLHLPMIVSLPCFATAFAFINQERMAEWAALFPTDLTRMRQQAMSAVWLLIQAWAISMFAMMYTMVPCAVGGARLSLWWATRRAAGV